ncbi:MAG: MOSC N-terminal beta barrel domain-containing protein [Chitinophagaceae bacterium]
MLQVSGIYVYPIKSLRGISLDSAEITNRGFACDRQWMLVNEQNNFLSQREFAQMALLQPDLNAASLVVKNTASAQSPLLIPLQPETVDTIMVNIWSDRCRAQLVGSKYDAWFTEALGMPCRLVFMPEKTNRRVDGRYAFNKETTRFTDGYPFMIVGQSSLQELNERLEMPVLMNRFRPSIVFTGGAPFEEDLMAEFSIAGINFFGVKLSARCVVTTIDQETGVAGKEPLKTLSLYRLKNKKIYFGQNLLHKGTGRMSVGDEIKVLVRKGLSGSNKMGGEGG